ncbi:MAG TPA: hypothetical protein VNA89_15240, partial [Gemmatimonadaceae bacterium]|nr:hypothetical protein [Gemmatimonadaceae bacterium]
GTETKRLLRQAMRGLLPASVLAPRPRRTGVTGAYFRRQMTTVFPALAEEAFRTPVLGELGIVDVDDLRRAVALYLRTTDANLGVQLFFTFQTELWLRGRSAGSRGGEEKDGLARVGALDRIFI